MRFSSHTLPRRSELQVETFLEHSEHLGAAKHGLDEVEGP